MSSLNTFKDGDSTTFLGSPVQCLATISVKNFLLMSSLNLPWHSLRPFPLVLSLVACEKRLTHLATLSFKGVVQSDQVTHKTLFLQTNLSSEKRRGKTFIDFNALSLSDLDLSGQCDSLKFSACLCPLQF